MTADSSGVVRLPTLSSVRLAESPYRYGVISQSFISATIASQLSSQFLSAGFKRETREEKTAGKKRYRTHNFQLINFGTRVEENLQRLTPLWQRLIDELSGPEYRDAVAAVTGCDLDEAILDVRLVRYGEADWIEPHVDRPDKLVTHLFYLNEHWRAEWAGTLLILRSNDMDDAQAEVLPLAGTSVLMVRSADAWHAVAPVRAAAAEQRKVLLLHFVRPANDQRD